MLKPFVQALNKIVYCFRFEKILTLCVDAILRYKISFLSSCFILNSSLVSSVVIFLKLSVVLTGYEV